MRRGDGAGLSASGGELLGLLQPLLEGALADAAIERAHAYAEAGASGFFVPGLADLKLLERVCAASPLPVNFMAFPGAPSAEVVAEALKLFYEIREVPGLKKKPSTSELLDWLKLLMVEDIGPETLRERDPKKLIPPLHGALLKNEQDVHLFERLAFLSRREV